MSKPRIVIHKKITWLLLFSIISLAIVSRLIYVSERSIENANARISQTYETIGMIQQLTISMTGSEANTQRFLQTGDGESATAIARFQGLLREDLDSLQRLTQDNGDQKNAIELLSHHLVDQKNFEDSLVAAALPGSIAGASAMARAKAMNHAIQNLLAGMLLDEKFLLGDRKSVIEVANRRTAYGLIVGRTAGFLFVVIVVIQLNRDITRRKEAETGLQQSEWKYRNLVENAGVVMYATDISGKISFVSKKATDLTGYPTWELEGMHFSTLVDASWLLSVTSTYNKQLKMQIPETTTVFLITTKYGEKKWVEQFAVLLVEKDGPIGFQCMVKDISEKKKMERELKKSELKLKENQMWLQSILDNTTSLVYIKDLQGRYILVNERFREVMKVEETQVIGKTDFAFRTREMADHYKQLDDQVIATGKSLEVEELLVTPQGEMNLLLVKFPLIDADKKVYGISGIATDITERVHNQQLLVVAIREAQEARQLQEQFLANMSHEIRTPMTGIKGMTDLLMETSLSEKQNELTSLIKRSANNLLVIINDILDFSKIKAGKLSLEKIDFSVKEVVGSVCSIFEHRLKKKKLPLHVTIDSDIPARLSGDPHRLNQVLINLLGNAVKFTDKGEIHIHASVARKTASQVVLRFQITDTGIGIPDDSFPYIFDSFSQAGGDITRKYGGTGLGLTICKQLLQLQGGDISATSTPGQGSEFTFHVPYEYSSRTTEDRPASSGIGDYSGLLEGKRFLVAEDNEINQKLIDHVLRRAGGKVTLANNGAEAIKYLQLNPDIDLIIMDLQMPEMDGYAATQFIRNDLQMQIPIIAMTATAMKGEQVQCLEIGMNAYMTKPFEFTDLYKRITGLLGAHAE